MANTQLKNSYIHIGSEPPYNDDFNASKNYMRIMYNPGRAVQGRELTQSQTILQNQLASIGSFLYKDGTPIIGSKISVSYVQPFMKVAATDTEGQPIDVNLLVGKTFTGTSSGQQINVTDCDSQNRYIFFSYLGGELSDGESFISTTTPTKSFYMVSKSTGKAITAHCDSGVIFVNGFYITLDESNIIVAAANTDDEYNIGFKIEEQFVTSESDSSLNDNAAGSTNANAPGADRYKLTASLYCFQGSNPPEDIKFISGITIKNKVIIKEQSNPLNDSELLDLLAKRTYDESGSYTVEPWNIQLYNDDDSSKYRVSVQEGRGYIRGYEVSTQRSIDILNDKPRDSILKNNVSLFNDNGVYTLGLQENNVLSATVLPEIQSTVIVKTESNGNGSSIGECVISSYYRENNNFRIYLINTNTISSGFSGARSIVDKNDSSKYINLYINESNEAVLYGDSSPFIFDSNNEYVKNIELNSISYSIVKRYTATSSANKTITISETDSTLDFLTTESLLSVFESSTGKQLEIGQLSLTPNNSGSTSTATITGSPINATTEYTIVVRLERTNANSRVKTIQTITETIEVSPQDTKKVLSQADIFDIVSFVQLNNKTESTPAELKSYISLNNGQTDYFYENGSIESINNDSLKSFKGNQNSNTTYSITYRYFNHSGTGPFTVNSYLTNNNLDAIQDKIVYDNIPIYYSNNGTAYNLRDCFDFRVKRSENISNAPSPRTEIKSSTSVYLPRYDIVYVSSNGTFGIAKGIPSEKPVFPILNDYSLGLYYIYNKPYVKSIDDVTIKYIDNKRYTMSDIEKLNVRLTNVEDAVSFTQLEQSAINMQITDENGLNRYKTGIFTDNFSSFDNSDLASSEWNANFDKIEQSLRANYNAENYGFILNEPESSNITKFDKIVSLPYTTEIYAENNYASESINVQKLLFYVWRGAIELTPSVDTWVNNLGVTSRSSSHSDKPKPPTEYRTWSETTYKENHQVGVDWGYGLWNGIGVGEKTTTTHTQTTTYVGSWRSSTSYSSYEKQDEFMRERDVSYKCIGMRPGVKHNAYIDGTPLSLSNAIPDKDGVLEGTFKIPPKIPCGRKMVSFEDADETSSADTYYSANGKTVWKRARTTYVRVWTPETTTTSRSETCPWDPVAESIWIEEDSGIYVDSIDIFFAAKDTTNIPVYVYLVECENGYPTTRVLPFSMVSKTPEEVNLSTDASVATNFKFAAPVFLAGKTEYAVIVATTSYEYEVFISTLGLADLKSGIGIHEQPYLGTMFLSQNTRTWTPEQQSDLTFKLYKCVFDTSTVSTAVFDLEIPENDFEVSMNTLAVYSFLPENTKAKYEYKWRNDSNYTQFNNFYDTFLPSLKVISGNADGESSLKLRVTLSTNNKNITPLIDLEQVFGVFCNNTLSDNTDIDNDVYPYNAGTYISKPINLKYSSDNIRVILDSITPNNSKVDVYIKTSAYDPIYVYQSTKGNVGTNKSAAESLKGKQMQVFYYDSTTKKLEPQTMVEITGSDNTKIFLRAVSNPDVFKNVNSASATESEYIGINSKYTHILLAPIITDTSISIDDWNNSSSYNIGDYVFYNGSIWTAIRYVSENQIPSENGISWKKIDCIKTVSTVTTDDTVIWRKLKQSSESQQNSETTFTEQTYFPDINIENEFLSFSIKIVMKSKDKVNIPRVKNLRAIATL